MGVIRDRARRSTPGWFHVRGGTITFGTALTAGGKGDIILSRTAEDTLTLAANDTFSAGGTVLITSGAGGGSILWGSEVNLYRGAGDQLKTDDNFFTAGTLKVGLTDGTFTVSPGGTVAWGLEAKLYKDATTKTLQTDAGFRTEGALKVGLTSGTFHVNTGGTVNWGTEVKLYRGACDTLKTDGTFHAAEGIITKEVTAAVGGPTTLTTNGQIMVHNTGGSTRLVARIAGTTWFVAMADRVT